jgi:hypothetical protein
VRLPKEYRVTGNSVYVKRLGNSILLIPKQPIGGRDCSQPSTNSLAILCLSAASTSRRVPTSTNSTIRPRTDPVYLLDTTVWIDLLRTNSSSIRRKISARRVSFPYSTAHLGGS